MVASRARRFQRTSKRGGQETGPNPTDRGKPGSKHHLIVDGQGIPLAVGLSAANVHDSNFFIPLIEAVPRIARPRGAPRSRPEKMHADKGYDFVFCRAYCQLRQIAARIARRGIESHERLGRYRWVVERSFAWLHQFKRLAMRTDRRADIHRGFLTLAASMVCLNFAKRTFC